MKFKQILIYSLISIPVLFTSCSHDNYPMPNAGIKGAVVDAASGEAVQTEQPNGIKIRLIEASYGSNVSPNDFWAKPDGTFENANVFTGNYKVIPVEGAFFPADTAEVNITGQVEVNFKVTPYLTIEMNVTAESEKGAVKVAYKISREKVADKIISCKVLASAYPHVSNIINEFNVSHDLSGTEDEAILSTNYTDKISGLTSGETYYFRVAASTNNAYNKYNYSKIISLKIP
ncbi:MAG TPA: DUF3823 domain-containing protein [Arachidicoccus sp.]|nr:DUF3823 domain-containing protein [Arachidicoccus sp.]